MAKKKSIKIYSKSAKKYYEYPNDAQELVKINKKIKVDFSAFCKKQKINKSQLIEKFYKSILVKFKDGSLNISSGYITFNIYS